MKTERHRIERAAPHSILGTLIGGSAAILPFIYPDPNRGFISPMEFVGYGLQAAGQGDDILAMQNLQSAGQGFVDGIVNNFLPIIGLAALGAGTSWAGRKYAKSSTNVSRKWRVF